MLIINVFTNTNTRTHAEWVIKITKESRSIGIQNNVEKKTH